MSTLTAGIVVPALNHVLSNEPWAISRLLPYAGKSLQIVAPPIELLLQISAAGMFSAADSRSAPPAIAVTLPNDSVLKLISGDHASALSSVRLSGSADFAETIAFVFRNLRWDAEADLASIIGDIPAHRAFGAIQKFIGWQTQSAINLGRNFQEYLTEESGQIVARQTIADFGQSVDNLRDDLARLEKRISRL